MFTVSAGEYSILVQDGGLPSQYLSYKQEAVMCDEHNRRGDGTLAFIAIQRAARWPELCISFRYANASAGFHPAVLVVPETEVAFIGAGESIWIYDLKTPRLLREEFVCVGFWAWQRHGQVVLMLSELELSGWALDGTKLWSTFVEPPWDFEVDGDSVTMDVMGCKSSFSLQMGPGPRVRE